jgi:hypothetical protein
MQVMGVYNDRMTAGCLQSSDDAIQQRAPGDWKKGFGEI